MAPSTITETAAALLRAALAKAGEDEQVKGIIAARDTVLARYQAVFAPDRLPLLTEDEFKGFLLFENNRHWTGLARKGNSLCADMPTLQKALAILLDESQPIRERLNRLIPKAAPRFVKKLGRAVVTAILHVTHPDKYGVYNGTSEAGMAAVGVLPSFKHSARRSATDTWRSTRPCTSWHPNCKSTFGRWTCAMVADEAQASEQAHRAAYP